MDVENFKLDIGYSDFTHIYYVNPLRIPPKKKTFAALCHKGLNNNGVDYLIIPKISDLCTIRYFLPSSSNSVPPYFA